MQKIHYFFQKIIKSIDRVAIVNRSALVSIYQTDVTSFSQLSIKYKNFENKLNPDPNPEPNPKPNPNQIEGENHL